MVVLSVLHANSQRTKLGVDSQASYTVASRTSGFKVLQLVGKADTVTVRVLRSQDCFSAAKTQPELDVTLLRYL